ncbi:7-cyano-7-deazaguanine synthase [Streptomyces chartreusis]
MEAIICFSGDMESTTLATMYLKSGYSISLLSFDYGQRRRDRELQSASDVANYLSALNIASVSHRIVDLSCFGKLIACSTLVDTDLKVPDSGGRDAADPVRVMSVPNRNAIIGHIAISLGSRTEADVVAMGMNADDHAEYSDCRPEFVKALRQSMTHALKGFHTPRLETPFLRKSKTEIAEVGVSLRAPLELSWACNRGGIMHCGTCGTCIIRKETFKNAALTDPTEYLA